MRNSTFLMFTALLSLFWSMAAVSDGSGNINVIGNTDNANDIDVYRYEIDSDPGLDPFFTEGQDRIMVRLDSPNHQVHVFNGLDSQGNEIWGLAAPTNHQAHIIFVPTGPGAVFFRVVNIAAVNDPAENYTLYLSNPPHTSIGTNIESNDGLPNWGYGIEADESISFSGTMVDQYHNIVPFAPTHLLVQHISGSTAGTLWSNITDAIVESDVNGNYSHTITFSKCTGGSTIGGASPGVYYKVGSSLLPFYAAWPMLGSEPSPQNPFGFEPVQAGGTIPGSLNLGGYGFKQSCNL